MLVIDALVQARRGLVSAARSLGHLVIVRGLVAGIGFGSRHDTLVAWLPFSLLRHRLIIVCIGCDWPTPARDRVTRA